MIGIILFISLETGGIIHVMQWTVLHITESVIIRVEQLDTDKGINEMLDGEMLFECNPGDPILLQPGYKEVIPP